MSGNVPFLYRINSHEKHKIVILKEQGNLVSDIARELGIACFVTASVGSNIIGHGATIGYPAILLPQLAQPRSAITLTTSAGSWIASVIGIPQLLGSFMTPVIMGRYGRKAAHFAVTMPGLIGWTVITMASTFEELLIGRIFLGLAIGMMSPLRSSLVGEYSSPKYRGALLTTVSLTQTFGIFVVHLLGSFLTWQVTALILIFCPFASLVMTIYSPESPSWLADKGRYEECREVYHWLRGEDEEEELEEMIQARIIEKRISKKPEKNKFKAATSTVVKNEFWKPITLMIHAYIMSNFAGATAMAAYSTVIIALVMGDDANAHFWMIFFDTQRLISNVIAVFFINRFKRRTMMFSTVSLSIVSQFAVATYAYFRSHGMLSYTAIWLPAVLFNIQIFTIATGIIPLPNVIGGEVFPLEYRGIGATISLSFLSTTFFLVGKTFPGLVESIGLHGTYLVHTAVLVQCFTVMWFMLPETKGKTLQQIEDEFRGKPLVADDEDAIEALQAESEVIRRDSQRRSSSVIVIQ